MRIFRALKSRLSEFHHDDEGSVVVEGILITSFLTWWYVASFQYFDAYRQKNTNLKAAYTIADMLSRETGPTSDDPDAAEVNQTYVNGLNQMFDYLSNAREPTWIRVSSVYFDENDDKYHVDWSSTSGSGHPIMTTAAIQNYKNSIPVLPRGGSVILVETFMDYEPMFAIGLDEQTFSTFITTAPRFASCLPWQTYGCGIDANGNWTNPDIPDLPDPEPDGT
ncbi:pilus assembly protein [Frigidibacter sp. RF13]|uniref:TadE/TadG family type IV pilus assembly protein n=1 Tax=Frigidibacter sp. RF13 TaxID=2997340 RepID=UPI00227059CD|nr:pilus assembly protein [Frigidibacter sp. RF13]MCY1127259.1 pilus assembly protein [Frigidibacter sp. RF13]